MLRSLTLYQRLPVALQNLACSWQGWRIQRRRYGNTYAAVERAVLERSAWPAERLLEFRDARLRSFVRHCAETVPYYRRAFASLGVDPAEIRTLADLSRLPLLSKRDLQEHTAAFLSEAAPADRETAHTSGTTGSGLRFTTTTQALQEQWATWWRFRGWHGIQPGTWCAYFGGRSVVPVDARMPPFWRYNLPGRQILFSGYHMSRRDLHFYCEELRRRRPPWLHGYPSLLALLAAHLLDAGGDLGYRPRWITTGAENLLPQQSELIRRAFGVNPLQHYGMAEGVANASQCERGLLHVDEDFAAVEFLPVPGDPRSYRVVGANLSNLAMPLLRYDPRDLVTLADSCACGRSGRVIRSVDGRREDYVVLGNGARIGRLDHVFKDLAHVREAQITQSAPGEMVVSIVRAESYTPADEASLVREMRQRVGDARLEIVYKEALPRTASGKLRFVVSTVPEGQLER